LMSVLGLWLFPGWTTLNNSSNISNTQDRCSHLRTNVTKKDTTMGSVLADVMPTAARTVTSRGWWC
jgi:hypothetical protein